MPHPQERLDILTEENNNGYMFHTTGGEHLTLDDMFTPDEINSRRENSREKKYKYKRQAIDER